MSQIKPTVGYVNAWHAVNEANTPKMGYSSLTAFKQEKFSNNVEAVYSVRRRGPLSQLLHSFMWAVSPGYRDKKLENRHALLNMIEDEIRTSSGSQAKYSRQGLKSYQGQEVPKNQIRTLGDRPSQAHREVWANGQPPAGLSKDVSTALKNAERNVGNRQAFLDSLHRVFIAAAAEIAPENEIQRDEGEHLLSVSTRQEMANPQQQQRGGNKPGGVEDIRVAMLEKASPQDMNAQLDVAIRNEHSKSRHTRGGRINPAAFESAITRRASANPEPKSKQNQPLPTMPVNTLEYSGSYAEVDDDNDASGTVHEPERTTEATPSRPLPDVPSGSGASRDSGLYESIGPIGSSHTLRDPTKTAETTKWHNRIKEDTDGQLPDHTYSTVNKVGKQAGDDGAQQPRPVDNIAAPPPKPPRKIDTMKTEAPNKTETPVPTPGTPDPKQEEKPVS